MRKILCLLTAVLAGTFHLASAGEFDTTVDMRATSATTFNVEGQIAGLGAVDLMVDTGSGYMTINEEMLARLKESGRVRYVKDLRGRLANGSELTVPVYAIESVSIGGGCWLKDVEAAVFPGATRPILGLSALQRAAPFIFSFEPPRLVLSNCPTTAASPSGDVADLAAFDN
ncbi:retroviral-like aspartic protease family protein [Aromatoleum toluclasticum]|uniref:retropepsin-like aspartic protease family protein n=1 Tax=Aromatoleum toluclasticum TaxID=92003 RepID=UPI001D194F06|nr:retropepsin-like aspartic protease [Aromatoleum toluclasticum]MCC4114346.1 retroviral-like aspartic protease family protein [Aromatoleum toluclasticum]